MALIPSLLLAALLLPLAAFALLLPAGIFLRGRSSQAAAGVSVLAILAAFVLSCIALIIWVGANGLAAPEHGAGHGEAHTEHAQAQPNAQAHPNQSLRAAGDLSLHPVALAVDPPAHASPAEQSPPAHSGDATHGHDAAHEGAAGQDGKPHDGANHAEGAHAAGEHAEHPGKVVLSGEWYTLAEFGSLRITIGYYIDALTVFMFCMVTLIASCVHIYATGYMHDELHGMYEEHGVTLANGQHLLRPGRYHRFFQYLSLFCFSMLGIVIAGNIAMVFVFWELVGICSYFLIGFYFEKTSASTAANKAFIANRVGDFGMIIGLMALFGALGTFNFADTHLPNGQVQRGLFSQVRPPENHYQLTVPDGMVRFAAQEQIAALVLSSSNLEEAEKKIQAALPAWRAEHLGYGLLVLAGIGIFCGCVGKSAQFPLHVWLPDAMEGPTPVSALVHSATMVAAGVYLVGRFYPVFAPEVLLVIAVIGCITLFMAASIAIVATDIKRVLAYSTVSQLGYMMLALGLGGWIAGLFHLITHAFFKSLLFMGSGSVIHACHTNEITAMGGLRHKMPYTAYTMLVGCLAIIGAGLPLVFFGPLHGIGLSGFYSKDAILEQAVSFTAANANGPAWMQWLFYAPAIGAAMTAFYMFRMWYMTFAGEPRDRQIYHHAHESPPAMYMPLLLLSVLAIASGWSFGGIGLTSLLEQARPDGTLVSAHGVLNSGLVVPDEHASHALPIRRTAALWAFSTAMGGLLLATVIYLWEVVKARSLKSALYPAWIFLRGKWFFDELYYVFLILPSHAVAWIAATFDKVVIDGFLQGLAGLSRWISGAVDQRLDRRLVDGSANGFARLTYGLGLLLRQAQVGLIRYYVLFIVFFTLALLLAANSWNVFAETVGR